MFIFTKKLNYFYLTQYQKYADLAGNCFWGAKCLSYYIVKMPNETEYHDENGPQERAKIKFDIF